MIDTRTPRRTVLKGALGFASLTVGTKGVAGAVQPHLPVETGDEEAFWQAIAGQYDVTREVVQVENGNWGMMPRPVFTAYQEHLARVNRDTSYYSRRGFGRDAMAVREEIADALGVQPDEIAFTRNATEALKALILGYNQLKPGEAVLYSDLDYDSMQASMDSLAARCKARVVRIALPEPASHQGLLAAYTQALDENPQVRLLLLTRIGHRTGLAVPVREIAAMARARGVDTIVDAAHSWYQIDGDIAAMDCDFVGVNGHKWLGAPLGLGVIHIRRGALHKIDPDPAEKGDAGVFSRVHTGTTDISALLTAPAALAFHARIGSERRTRRLRALRSRWVDQARTIANVQILTPEDPELSASITSFRLKGRTSVQANKALAKQLLDRHGIFTIHRDGVASGACVRITPALFNSMAEMDKVAAAIAAIASN